MLTIDDDDDDIPPARHDSFSFEDKSTTKMEIAMLQNDFPMLSLPDLKSKLYKLWPSLNRHLGSQFQFEGPNCYGNDPQ
jgi:hypothetical protein